MRFLIVFSIMCSSVSMAAVSDFNSLVKATTSQEKRLHRKLLQSIQQTQIAIAYNDRLEQIRGEEAAQKDILQVRLVRSADSAAE